jgi:antiviral helicase SLH1
MKVDATQTQSKMIRVHVRRLNRGYTDRNNVYAPKFPKPQQESWFVVASDAGGDKLLSLQRLTLSGRGGTDGTIELEVPENYTGESVVIRVVSDGWRGVDVEKAVAWKTSEDVRDT